jgi:hypothetical protein
MYAPHCFKTLFSYLQVHHAFNFAYSIYHVSVRTVPKVSVMFYLSACRYVHPPIDLYTYICIGMSMLYLLVTFFLLNKIKLFYFCM